MTTTDDARLLEIEARYGGEMAVFTRGRERIEISVELLSPFLNVASDVRYLLDRLKAAESRIRELERIAEDALGMLDAVADARKDSENVTAAIAMESVARHLRQRLTTLHSNEVQGGV